MPSPTVPDAAPFLKRAFATGPMGTSAEPPRRPAAGSELARLRQGSRLRPALCTPAGDIRATLPGAGPVVEGEGVCVQGGVGDASDEQPGHRGSSEAGRDRLGRQVRVSSAGLEAAEVAEAVEGHGEASRRRCQPLRRCRMAPGSRRGEGAWRWSRARPAALPSRRAGATGRGGRRLRAAAEPVDAPRSRPS